MLVDSFFEKLWLQTNLNSMAIRRVGEVIESQGKALPCKIQAVSGQIVTVDFSTMDTRPWVLPSVTVPVAESPYHYWPLQAGDTGVVLPLDAHVASISGINNILPRFQQKLGNLSALVFVPVGNKSFSPVDSNASQIQGPNGVVLQTTQGVPSSVVTNQQGTTITYGTTTLVVNASGISLIVDGVTVMSMNSSGPTLDGTVTINGIVFSTHEHTDVAPGSSNSGGPVSP